MNQHERNALDRYITGNYGEDQFRDYPDDDYEESPVTLNDVVEMMFYFSQMTGDRVYLSIECDPNRRDYLVLQRDLGWKSVKGQFSFFSFTGNPNDSAVAAMDFLLTEWRMYKILFREF